MPFNFFKRNKRYGAVSQSQEPLRSSTGSPDTRLTGDLYHPPTSPTAAGTPKDACPTTPDSNSSTRGLYGSFPRRGPLIDVCYDSDEPDEETERSVDEVRKELRGEGFGEMVDAAGRSKGREAATKEVRFGQGVAASDMESYYRAIEGRYVSDGEKKREDLLMFFDVDEDAIEMDGELRVDEEREAMVETLFDGESATLEVSTGSTGLEMYRKTLRIDTSADSISSDDSWCTSDDIASSPTEDSRSTEDNRDTAPKTRFLTKWLRSVKQTNPTEANADTELLVKSVDPDEFNTFGSKEADGWIEVSGNGSGLDSLFAQMEVAEEGQSTKFGPPQEMRLYRGDRSDSPEYVVVDRPSLDFLDRLGALEGAILREVKE